MNCGANKQFINLGFPSVVAIFRNNSITGIHIMLYYRDYSEKIKMVYQQPFNIEKRTLSDMAP